MLKPSEIIRMAMNHPSYLNGRDWLCDVVWYICTSKDVNSFVLSEQTQVLIMDSLKGERLLRRYLINQGVIPGNTMFHSQEYKQAAFEHWNKLIEKLEKEGK